MKRNHHTVPTWRVRFRRHTGQPDVTDVAAVSIVFRRGLLEFLDESQSPTFIVSPDRLTNVALLGVATPGEPAIRVPIPAGKRSRKAFTGVL